MILASVLWVTPAPQIGLGLKQTIDGILDVEEAFLESCGLHIEWPPLRTMLYDQLSPIPAVWAIVLRNFPIAVALLWAIVRRLPQELMDSAVLDGGRWAVWCGVIWPLSRLAFIRTTLVVSLLGLGDVVASKLVQPPGRQSFAQELFNAMHYGSDATVAAMCLLQLAVTAVVSVAFIGLPPLRLKAR
jgi:ABC-type spermidine/putrescine transport system permease subunit II